MKRPLEPALQSRIDAYLKRLRQGLGELPAAEAAEVEREIRGHILERIDSMHSIDASALTVILEALGKPEDLGALYQSRAMVARARASLSPLLILRTAVRWAGKSIGGLAACVLALFGYTTGLSCVVSAILKIFHPDRVGLWVGPHTWNLSMGYLTAAERIHEHAHEVLGWWLIPVMFMAGPIILIVTTIIVRWGLRFAFPPIVAAGANPI
jgi:hypothetical protein